MEIADLVLDRPGQARVAQGDRARPARPRPPLPAGLLQAPHRAGLGALGGVGRRPGRHRATGTRTTESGGSRCGPGPPWSRAAGARHRLTMRILVTGADGQLGQDLLSACRARCQPVGAAATCGRPKGHPTGDHEVLATDIANMRVDDRDAVQTAFRAFRPELVLHGGALTAVDLCESEVDLAYAVNAVGHPQRGRGRRRGRGPHGLRLDRLRLRRHLGAALPGVGPPQPPVGLRRLQAGR